jgi:monovalent cation/hydrogen antiporter
VAATATAGKLGLPRRLAVVLGGEGLFNDVTAIVTYSVAIHPIGGNYGAAVAIWRRRRPAGSRRGLRRRTAWS